MRIVPIGVEGTPEGRHVDRFRILGELSVPGHPGPLPCGPKPQVMLAALLLQLGTTVTDRSLVEAVWGDRPPANGAEALYTHASRLRALLRRAGHRQVALERRVGGYLLTADPALVDVHEFRARVSGARSAGDDAARHEALDAALALWSGVPLRGLPGRWAGETRRMLLQEHLGASLAWAEVALRLGRAEEVVTRLTGLRSRNRLVEPLTELLMRGLAETGRLSEALRCFAEIRRVLADELGVEPGPALRGLHESLLRDTSAPAAAVPAPPPPGGAWSPSGPAVPAQLPLDVRAFTGRESELAALDAVLADAGTGSGDGTGSGGATVCALSGTAGVGKTALAVRWAHRVAPDFPDGQLFVDLRGYDPDSPVDPLDALAGFLHALGVDPAEVPPGPAERAARYRTELAGRRMLVVLDNAASEEHARPLLPGSGPSMALVTSRDSLTGLAVREGAHRINLHLLSTAEALALLRTLVGDRVDDEPEAAATLVAYCARLPLALRVAAELVRERGDRRLAEVVADLRDEHGRLAVLERHGDDRTAVRAVVSWSCRNLSPDAALVFRRLGLHPGPDTGLHGAAALAGLDLARTGRALHALRAAHLVQPAGGDRYTMHDLLRAYARRQVDEHDDASGRAAAVHRLLESATAAAEAAAVAMHGAGQLRPLPGPAPEPADEAGPGAAVVPVPSFDDADTALAHVDAELPVLISIAELAVRAGWPGHAVRVANALVRHLDGRCRLAEALRIHGLAVRAAGSLGHPGAEAHALVDLAVTHRQLGQYEVAAEQLRRAEAVGAAAGDPLPQARAAGNTGILQALLGRSDDAIASSLRALELYRRARYPDGEMGVFNNLGYIYERLGEYERSLEYTYRSLELARRLGNDGMTGVLLDNIGSAHQRRGEYGLAVEHHRQALDLVRRGGWRVGEVNALNSLGEAYRRLGDLAAAVACQEEALAVSLELASAELEVASRNGLGAVLLRMGRAPEAIEHLTASLALQAAGGDVASRLEALVFLAEAHRAGGEARRAAEVFRRALALAEEIGHRELLTQAANGLAEVLVAAPPDGDGDAAAGLFARALELATATGDRVEQARAHEGLAGCHHRAGDRARAEEQAALARAARSGVDRDRPGPVCKVSARSSQAAPV